MDSNDGQILALSCKIAELERFKEYALFKNPELDGQFQQIERERSREESKSFGKCCCGCIVIGFILFILYNIGLYFNYFF